MQRLHDMEDRGVMLSDGQARATEDRVGLRHAIERVEVRGGNIEYLLRHHLADGEILVTKGIENDRRLWGALREAGIDIEYDEVQQEALHITRELLDSLDDMSVPRKWRTSDVHKKPDSH